MGIGYLLTDWLIYIIYYNLFSWENMKSKICQPTFEIGFVHLFCESFDPINISRILAWINDTPEKW